MDMNYLHREILGNYIDDARAVVTYVFVLLAGCHHTDKSGRIQQGRLATEYLDQCTSQPQLRDHVRHVSAYSLGSVHLHSACIWHRSV